MLFDTNLSTGTLGEATLIEEGVTVIWPEALSFELPGCTVRPTLIESTSYVTSKVFRYAYPDTCTPVESSEVAAQAVVTISKNGTTSTVTDTTSTVGEQTFTASGTWTAPSGVTSVTVECWGGGGGGGKDRGSGGGGGAYSRKAFISVTPGAAYTVSVGSGGAGADFSSNTNREAGGDSWFSTQGTVLAKGGSGSSGGLSGSGVGDIKYSGGDGSGSIFGAGGGGGSSAGTASNGVNANISGATAPSGGGNGASGSGENGFSGTSPGGGAGGGGDYGDGGSGASGKAIVSWN